jgi:hypothetical protein
MVLCYIYMYIKRADDGHGDENHPKTEWTIMTKQYNIFLRRTQSKNVYIYITHLHFLDTNFNFTIVIGELCLPIELNFNKIEIEVVFNQTALVHLFSFRTLFRY